MGRGDGQVATVIPARGSVMFSVRSKAREARSRTRVAPLMLDKLMLAYLQGNADALKLMVNEFWAGRDPEEAAGFLAETINQGGDAVSVLREVEQMDPNAIAQLRSDEGWGALPRFKPVCAAAWQQTVERQAIPHARLMIQDFGTAFGRVILPSSTTRRLRANSRSGAWKALTVGAEGLAEAGRETARSSAADYQSTFVNDHLLADVLELAVRHVRSGRVRGSKRGVDRELKREACLAFNEAIDKQLGVDGARNATASHIRLALQD